MSDDYENDGLGDFSLDQIGMQTGAFGGARLLKFNDGQYITREGEVIEPSRELMVLGLKKVVQKFVNKKLVETEIVPDGEPAPSIKAKNEACPREEWGTDLNGNPAGPYVLVLALKLLDENTMDRFVFVTQSKGGSIAIGDLSDKTKIIRRIKNDNNIVPIVSCRSINFPIKRLNIVKKRPDFRVLRFTKLGGSNGRLPAPETPKPIAPPTASTPPSTPSTPPAAAAFTASAQQSRSPMAISTPVPPLTLAEEVNDTVLLMRTEDTKTGARSAHPFSFWGGPCVCFLISKPLARSTSPKSDRGYTPDIRRRTFDAFPIASSLTVCAAQSRPGCRASRCRKPFRPSLLIPTLKLSHSIMHSIARSGNRF